MKIKHIYIKNFKSIDELEIDCNDLSIFVGKNSVGKSNMLLALDLFFNTSDRVLADDMFCTFGEGSNEIVIELTFGNLTQVEKNGRLKKYICPSIGDGIRVRKIVIREDNKLKSRYHGWIEEPEKTWLQSGFRDYKQAFWVAKGINFFDYVSAEGGRITQVIFEEFRQNYIETHRGELEFQLTLSSTEFEGFKTVGVDMLPEFCLIPAIGDVADIVAGTTKSLLARMVGNIIRAVGQEVEVLKNAEQGLQMASGLINRDGMKSRLPQIEAIENWLRDEFLEWGKVDFEISTSFPEIHSLLTQNLQLLVDDGAKGDVSTKGHGLQRQLIFKMIRLNAALVQGEVEWVDLGSALTEIPPIILAFEEPELYLHPQAQLSFYEDIKKLSAHDQIFLCTHSTHLVEIEDFEDIKILVRDSLNAPTKVFECTEEIFGDLTLKKRLALAKLFDANVNKIFFADKIVIVEGDEEIIAITRTARKHASCFSHRVTIVNAKGKGNIPGLQRVLNAFGVPYTVVYDVDPGNTKSQDDAKRIEDLVARAPFGFGAAMPMDPNLATVVGYEETKEGKDAACIEFLEENKPTDEFIEKVAVLYKLPAAGIIIPG